MSAARTWGELVAEVGEWVGSVEDARRLAEEASGLSRAALVAAYVEPVPALQATALARMAARRATGEPLQYALGRWGFRKLDLMVDRRVLIPRPETEQVVEVALEQARLVGARRVADLGTGSGAIALSLAVELDDVEVWATDISVDALDVARANLSGLGGFAATRVRMAVGSWYDALPPELAGSVDVVVSNPPYIADDEALPDEVATWEPALALRAGPTGLEALAAVIEGAPSWLSARGVVVCELAPHQTSAAIDLAGRAGLDAGIRADLAGRDRVLVARRST